jgi:hypothetical protein
VKREHKEGGPITVGQFPVDARPGYITEVTFCVSSGAVAFRAAATNITTVGAYAADTEYWYTRTQGLAAPLAMTGSVAVRSAADIDAFHADSAAAFHVTQAIGPSGWTRGTYSPTTGRTATLFKAPDPDNSRLMVGVLFEQDARNQLTRVVWYKTSDTGTIWAATPATLTWAAVLNGAGSPSTNPNDISATTWYYAAGP